MNKPEKTIEEFVNPERAPKVKWSTFIETDVVNFFNFNELEKMTLENGNGNKAKLTRQKDNGIKVEYSSMTIL